MLHFDSDYMQTAHPLILERIAKTQNECYSGYGTDEICASAIERIRKACEAPQAEVHFLIGGTQTNAVCIDALLRSYQGVLCASTAHIQVHEAGAIEATGHKVLPLPEHEGKITADSVETYVKRFYADANWEHEVMPGMLYITHPTEYGTLYTLSELEAISRVCRENHMPLYLDGARLGYALAATHTDVTLPDIARLTDAFYIGGTKVGAMMGEAVVFPRPGTVSHFLTQMKRHNALLAKGWLLGLQFDVLFTDNLYLNISRNAIVTAERLREGLLQKGYELYIDSPTNQQFIVCTPQQLADLGRHTTYGFWENLPDGRTVVRLATSWATRQSDVDSLLAEL